MKVKPNKDTKKYPFFTAKKRTISVSESYNFLNISGNNQT